MCARLRPLHSTFNWELLVYEIAWFKALERVALKPQATFQLNLALLAHFTPVLSL